MTSEASTGASERDAYIKGVEDERRAASKLIAAVLAYDEAIVSCANNPVAMASFCSVAGENLDTLYDSMVAIARTMAVQVKRGA